MSVPRAQLDQDTITRLAAELARRIDVSHRLPAIDVRPDTDRRNGKANGANGHPIWSDGLVAPRKGRTVKHPSAVSRVAGLAHDLLARQRRNLGEAARVLVKAERSDWTQAALAIGAVVASVLVILWR